MAPLSWNIFGWIYQDGVRSLRQTYEAASSGIDAKIAEAYRAVEEYDAAVAAGAPEQIERDEEGHVIADNRDFLIYHTESAEETKGALNKAVAITQFHHWERSARSWTGQPHGKFATLCDHVRAMGHPIDPRLEDLQLVVNLLKHANDKHGFALFAKRPDLFRAEFHPTPSVIIDWYEELQVGESTIGEFFEIIAGSGPQGTSIFGSA